MLEAGKVTRRGLIRGAAGVVGASFVRRASWAGDARVVEQRLVIQPSRVALVGSPHPDTLAWTYNGVLPGPEIRIRQGERLRVRVENKLDQETTIHWHGVRVPNAMDGVPHLTQAPIAPGGTFTYEFDVPDAGTFWYHPHHRSFEQVGRGLAGALIVDEAEPPAVDRDLTWVLGDWRLLPNAAISDDFGNLHDVSHDGRIGNTVTINGRVPDAFPVSAGERIRLRLVNAANARIFALNFQDHRPAIIALDGQPVAPHEPAGGRVVLGPAMRADLVLDMVGAPRERFTVSDTFYEGLEYRLVDLVYRDAPLAGARKYEQPRQLAANPVPRPNLATAERHDVVLGGGMMGKMTSATVSGKTMDMRSMMHNGLAWAINGVAAQGHMMDPLLTLSHNRSYVLAVQNDTAWQHPIHLHGHVFRVLSRDGRHPSREQWGDTVMVNSGERVEIAFVADNPGDWMLHCHILEHQAGGMMGIIRVS